MECNSSLRCNNCFWCFFGNPWYIWFERCRKYHNSWMAPFILYGQMLCQLCTYERYWWRLGWSITFPGSVLGINNIKYDMSKMCVNGNQAKRFQWQNLRLILRNYRPLVIHTRKGPYFAFAAFYFKARRENFLDSCAIFAKIKGLFRGQRFF